jgi:hypothetical protein
MAKWYLLGFSNVKVLISSFVISKYFVGREIEMIKVLINLHTLVSVSIDDSYFKYFSL